MLDDKKKFQEIISTTIDLFETNKELEIANLLRTSKITSAPTDYDNWNGGITFYSIYITVSVDEFVKIQSKQQEIEKGIEDKLELVLRANDSVSIDKVYIIPQSSPEIEWAKLIDLSTKKQLITDINYLKDIMISVSTGRARIQDVNMEYQKRFASVDKTLKQFPYENPNPFADLWQWYQKWSSGAMPQYKDRRTFIGELYLDLLNILQKVEQLEFFNIPIDLTGWERIDRTVKEIKLKLKQALNEEQFQAIGLLCRETIISLAQAVYNEDKHKTLDNVKASKTDSKRMLDAYIAAELEGRTNENLRKYARASNDLANELTHKRTANAKDAALCSSATISLVNLIGILEDRH